MLVPCCADRSLHCWQIYLAVPARVHVFMWQIGNEGTLSLSKALVEHVALRELVYTENITGCSWPELDIFLTRQRVPYKCLYKVLPRSCRVVLLTPTQVMVRAGSCIVVLCGSALFLFGCIVAPRSFGVSLAQYNAAIVFLSAAFLGLFMWFMARRSVMRRFGVKTGSMLQRPFDLRTRKQLMLGELQRTSSIVSSRMRRADSERVVGGGLLGLGAEPMEPGNSLSPTSANLRKIRDGTLARAPSRRAELVRRETIMALRMDRERDGAEDSPGNSAKDVTAADPFSVSYSSMTMGTCSWPPELTTSGSEPVFPIPEGLIFPRTSSLARSPSSSAYLQRSKSARFSAGPLAAYARRDDGDESATHAYNHTHACSHAAPDDVRVSINVQVPDGKPVCPAPFASSPGPPIAYPSPEQSAGPLVPYISWPPGTPTSAPYSPPTSSPLIFSSATAHAHSGCCDVPQPERRASIESDGEDDPDGDMHFVMRKQCCRSALFPGSLLDAKLHQTLSSLERSGKLSVFVSSKPFATALSQRWFQAVLAVVIIYFAYMSSCSFLTMHAMAQVRLAASFCMSAVASILCSQSYKAFHPPHSHKHEHPCFLAALPSLLFKSHPLCLNSHCQSIHVLQYSSYCNNGMIALRGLLGNHNPSKAWIAKIC